MLILAYAVKRLQIFKLKSKYTPLSKKQYFERIKIHIRNS
jgi:hypothetical protein